jgi:hypothetical protein
MKCCLISIFTFHLEVWFSWYLATETKSICWKFISFEDRRLCCFGSIRFVSDQITSIFIFHKIIIRYHFIFIPTNLVINVRQWTWLICEKYTTFINWIIWKLKMLTPRPKSITHTSKTTWNPILQWYIFPTYIFVFSRRKSSK